VLFQAACQLLVDTASGVAFRRLRYATSSSTKDGSRASKSNSSAMRLGLYSAMPLRNRRLTAWTTRSCSSSEKGLRSCISGSAQDLFLIER
jgi:hypothetical protein